MEYKLKAPKDSGLDDAHVNGIVEWAKGAKVDPAVAQAVLDRDAASAHAAREAAVTQKQAWLDDLKAHYKAAEKPDEFHDLDVRVTSLIDKFAPKEFPDFRKWLTESGIGHHRAFFSFMANIANAGREGSIVRAGIPTATMSFGKQQFPKSPINWSPEERAEWEAAGRPQF